MKTRTMKSLPHVPPFFNDNHLIVLEFRKLLENSASMSFEDLKVLRKDRRMRVRLGGNLLQDFFLALTDMLETASQETQERERLKRRRTMLSNPPHTPHTPHPFNPTTPPHTTTASRTNISPNAESKEPSTVTHDTPRYPK